MIKGGSLLCNLFIYLFNCFLKTSNIKLHYNFKSTNTLIFFVFNREDIANMTSCLKVLSSIKFSYIFLFTYLTF